MSDTQPTKNDDEILKLIGAAPENPIKISMRVLGDVVNELLYISSPTKGVKLAELALVCPPEIPDTIEGLMMYGSKPWDAIYAILSGQITKVKIYFPNQDVLKEKELREKLLTEAFMIIKIHIFFVMITGRHPRLCENFSPRPPLPEFIINYFNYKKTESELADSLSNFPLDKIDINLFEYIDLSRLEDILRPHTATKTPWYLFIDILTLVAPSSNTPIEALETRDLILKHLGKGGSLDFFPLNRHVEFFQTKKEFDNNFQNLIPKLYSIGQLKKMKQLKLISSIPVENPGDDK